MPCHFTFKVIYPNGTRKGEESHLRKGPDPSLRRTMPPLSTPRHPSCNHFLTSKDQRLTWQGRPPLPAYKLHHVRRTPHARITAWCSTLSHVACSASRTRTRRHSLYGLSHSIDSLSHSGQLCYSIDGASYPIDSPGHSIEGRQM